MPAPPGTLYVVATPIGNLEDLTFRALRTLREVDLIAAEDTRRTAKLLAHYEIRKPLVSVREHNERGAADRLVEKLLGGQDVAFVSDAGTPGIADPGARLVETVRARGIRVIPIPGVSAVAAALSVAGLAIEEFVFMGFPPAGGSGRNDWFRRLAAEPRAVVFFEAPHRIEKTMARLKELLVTRQILVLREITKINEELVMCSINTTLNQKGEFTLVVGPVERQPEAPVDPGEALELFYRVTESLGLSEESAVDVVALLKQIPTKAATKLIKKGKILVKQHNDSVP